jgi:hypothetical protein
MTALTGSRDTLTIAVASDWGWCCDGLRVYLKSTLLFSWTEGHTYWVAGRGWLGAGSSKGVLTAMPGKCLLHEQMMTGIRPRFLVCAATSHLPLPRISKVCHTVTQLFQSAKFPTAELFHVIPKQLNPYNS